MELTLTLTLTHSKSSILYYNGVVSDECSLMASLGGEMVEKTQDVYLWLFLTNAKKSRFFFPTQKKKKTRNITHSWYIVTFHAS